MCLLALVSRANAVNDSTAVYAGLQHAIQTDKHTYGLPEYVFIQYSITNVSPDPIAHPVPCCGVEIVVSVYDSLGQEIWLEPDSCFPSSCMDTLEVGESYTAEPVWDMYNFFTSELIEEPGVYRVEGALQTLWSYYEYEISVDIEILERETLVPELTYWPSRWTTIKALYR